METIKSKNDYKITLSIPQSATKKEVYDELKQKIDLTFSEKTDDYEIPFGAKDSELKGWEYTIPDGFEAEIKDGKVIVREKESEDERVRKELLDAVDKARVFDIDKDVADRWTAWLEKQKEQKPSAEEVLIKAGLKPYKDGNQWSILIGDNIQEGVCGFGDTIEDALCELLKDIQEQQPALPAQVAIDAVNHGFERVSDFEKGKEEVINDPEKYGLCKPAEWSEEEKGILLECISVLQNSSYWLLADRLSSLRPQPKQEWSEEDVEKLAKNRASKSGTLKSEMIFYRQGVRDAFNYKGMRPHWKPSEEQMYALEKACSGNMLLCSYSALSSLYYDLKKLNSDD